MPDYGNPAAIPDFARADPAQWFALAVKSRSEKAVARLLEMKGYETLLPLYIKQHRGAAGTKESKVPLFPGYVFCRFNPWTKVPVLITPGVTHVVGMGSTPLPVNEREIASLRTVLNAHLRVQPIPFVGEGHKVRISHGVLAGVEGTVMNCRRYLRLVLSITLLQRSVLIEVDRGRVRVEQSVKLAA